MAIRLRKINSATSLEDNAYQCIDNLPVTLLHSLVEENLNRARRTHTTGRLYRCLSEALQTFPEILQSLPLAKKDRRVVYLDAKSPTLVKRFSETRRRHPLTSNKIDLRQAIDMEAQVLATIADPGRSHPRHNSIDHSTVGRAFRGPRTGSRLAQHQSAVSVVWIQIWRPRRCRFCL